MCLYVCVYMCIFMFFFTATLSALSHEVNPGHFHQFHLRGGSQGQTSAACVGAAAPVGRALHPERKEELALLGMEEAGGEAEGEAEAEGASRPGASCQTLLLSWRGLAFDGGGGGGSGVMLWSLWFARVSDGGFGWVWG